MYLTSLPGWLYTKMTSVKYRSQCPILYGIGGLTVFVSTLFNEGAYLT